MAPRFYTLSDVATLLSSTEAQVYALVRTGDLPAIKIGGRGQWRIEITVLDQWIADQYAATKTYVEEHPVTDASRKAGPRKLDD
ncbi:helix-turn-helix transcriptional regulator [Terrabacter sp. 2TAF16]|uniref:helix-turn-helix transcriptional regulator n=1 Tax=Terrabacter sp. 2TAF16 TaxID=3233008 RepID=UPI003F96749E